MGHKVLHSIHALGRQGGLSPTFTLIVTSAWLVKTAVSYVASLHIGINQYGQECRKSARQRRQKHQRYEAANFSIEDWIALTDRWRRRPVKIKSRVTNIYQNNKFSRHSRHSAWNHFASSVATIWSVIGCWQATFPLGWSSTAFLDDNLWMLLLNYPSYGSKHMACQRYWLRYDHSFFWYLRRKQHAIIVLSRSVNHRSIMNLLNMPLKLVMSVQQWWAPSRSQCASVTLHHQPSVSPLQLCNLTFSNAV